MNQTLITSLQRQNKILINLNWFPSSHWPSRFFLRESCCKSLYKSSVFFASKGVLLLDANGIPRHEALAFGYLSHGRTASKLVHLLRNQVHEF